MEATAANPYPMNLAVDYPETLNRWTTAFRLVLVLPVLIVLRLLSTGGIGFQFLLLGGASLLFVPTVLLLVFRHKYPRWWFDFALNFLRFEARVTAYLFLLRDEYPSVDEAQHVHLDVPYPDTGQDLNRWLPLIKWFLAIPHYVLVAILDVAATIVSVIAWFAILFTGRYPRGLFNFVVNVFRWSLRVTAYAFLLTTDRYPPFQLGP